MKPVVVAALLCVAAATTHAQNAPEKGAAKISLSAFLKQDRQTQVKTLSSSLDSVATRISDRLISPVDSKGQRKSAERLETEKKRASYIKEVVRDFDSAEVAVRIQLAADKDSSGSLESVLARYITDEVLKREKGAQKKK